MLSDSFISSLRSIAESTFCDEIDIYYAVNTGDGYGDTTARYPDHSKDPPDPPDATVFGRLQAVIRIPGTPEIASSEAVIGNFVVVVPVGTKLNKQTRLVVNHGDEYQVMNVYHDKRDATTNQAYCDRIDT